MPHLALGDYRYRAILSFSGHEHEDESQYCVLYSHDAKDIYTRSTRIARAHHRSCSCPGPTRVAIDDRILDRIYKVA